MLEIIVILLIGAVLLILTGIGMYNMGRVSVKSEDFRCLYCNTLVIGAKSADKMVHILCIDRAPGDLAAIKQTAIAPEDNYFMDFKPVTKKYLSEKDNQPNWKYVGTLWTSTQADLYRNGEKISSWTSLDKEVLKERLNQEIELDKHKQKTKRMDKNV